MMHTKIYIKEGCKEDERIFLGKWWGNNVSLTLSNVKDTKNIEDLLVENIKEIIYSYEDENSPEYSKDGQLKYSQKLELN